MQPDPGRGYVLETTGADLGRDDPQRSGPDSTVGEVAARLAGQICEREARCHDDAPAPDACLRAYTELTMLEVVSWPCSPAATRARAKECIAALNAEPCEMDLNTKPGLCPASDVCPDASASLVPPGAAEAARAAGSATGTARTAKGPRFDRDAAVAVLGRIDLRPCWLAEGPRGNAHVTVTFAPDGGVLDSVLDTGPDGSLVDLDGTPRGQCIIERVRKARIPVFDEPPRSVGVAVVTE
jgi:hypothetical protein